jgi:FkbM family methyltransferase
MIRTFLPALFRRLHLGRLLDRPFFERIFLSSFFAYKRFMEDPLANLLRKHPGIVAGGDVLDVGANVGYTADVLARAIAPGRRVWAFEPEPVNFRRMTETLARRGVAARVTTVQAAVGDAGGTLKLWLNANHPGDHRVVTGKFQPDAEAISVPVIAIDDFVQEHGIEQVAFVKIDVQGFELMVARGMSRLIERTPSLTILFEYDPPLLAELGFDPKELLDFFTTAGFQLHIVTRRGELVGAGGAAIGREVAKRGYADLLCSRSTSLS